MNIEKVERLVKCHAQLVDSVKEYAGTSSNATRYVSTTSSDNAVEILAKAIIDECGTTA